MTSDMPPRKERHRRNGKALLLWIAVMLILVGVVFSLRVAETGINELSGRTATLKSINVERTRSGYQIWLLGERIMLGSFR